MVMEEVGRGEYVQNTLHEILKELIKKIKESKNEREREKRKPACSREKRPRWPPQAG